MAISEDRLKKRIKDAMIKCQKETDNPDGSLDKIAEAIANAVIEELKAAVVTGTCPPNGGPLTLGKIT
ncbi:hypothetical protein [Chryseobacterium sp. YR221]|uniref:hypothetical protein n=1 Tax=Chryseobacterium sp. YR221 TaxID=1500293 RepID=UPI0009D8ED3A|nr:hypothetical protein [Chryseobacterium sp. YR221]SMC75489.1 hypothetical protein SAMN02787074_2865 [Chryseobacterium sp. YR221]